MLELRDEEYSCVLPLMKAMEYLTVFAYSVIENKQPGTIYVNRRTSPSCALIVSRGGKYLLVGDSNDYDFNRDVFAFFSDTKNHWIYFDLFTSSEQWLDQFVGIPQTVSLYRNSFSFNESRFQNLKSNQIELPMTYEMKPMNKMLFQKYKDDMDDLYNILWSSTESLLEKGFGYCILHDNQFVSVCNSFTVGKGYAEIDIVTIEKSRRFGFATATCSAFINHCLKNDLIPNWDCDAGNQASIQLATNLGFEKKQKIKMLWWHQNIDVMNNYLKNYSYL